MDTFLEFLNFIFIVGFVLIFLEFMATVISIIIYVCTSLGVEKILQKYEYKKSWMAWLPYFRQYALGDIAAEGEYRVEFLGREFPSLVFKFPWVPNLILSILLIPVVEQDADVIGGVTIILGIIFIIISICQAIVFGEIYTRIYSRVENRPREDVKVIGYLSGFIGLIPFVKFLRYDDTKIDDNDSSN